MVTIKARDIDTVLLLSRLKGIQGFGVVKPLYVKFNWFKLDWECCIDMKYEENPEKRADIIDMCTCSWVLK